MRYPFLRVGTRTSRVALWLLCASVPLWPYISSLLNYTWADSPLAYLVWIPVFGLAWATLRLYTVAPYQDDRELNVILGLPGSAFVGLLLVLARFRWPWFFVGHDAALLLWPLWALCLAWLMFGVAVTRWIIAPLLYLVLCWPPLYSWVVAWSEPPLNRLALVWSRLFYRFSWVQRMGHGSFQIEHHHTWTPVFITSVCNGVDGLLATLVFVPVIFLMFSGSWWRKLALIAVAAGLSILMNLARLFILVVTLHAFGAQFSLGILHPMLGFVLFAGILLLISVLARPTGLHVRTFKMTTHLRVAGRTRTLITLVGALALTIGLWPLYQWTHGSPRAPITLGAKTISDVLPGIKGYRRVPLLKSKEASVLGPGAYTYAVNYVQPAKPYVMTEIWMTSHDLMLAGLTVNNCLLFHGYQVLASRQWAMEPGVVAHAFVILAPPSTVGGPSGEFIDLSYMVSVKYHHQKSLMRVEFAMPVGQHVQNNARAVTHAKTFLTALSHQGAGVSLVSLFEKVTGRVTRFVM